MADYYVDSVNGLDTNAGTALAPFASLTQALSVTVTDYCRIFIVNCTVFGGNHYITRAGTTIIGLGDCTFDCSGYAHFARVANDKYYISIHNVKITGFTNYLTYIYEGNSNSISYLNCTIFQKGSLADVTYIYGVNAYYNQIPYHNFINCTCVNVLIGGYNGATNNYIRWWNSIIITTYVHSNGHHTTISNASNLPDLYNGGWDTASYPPPFLNDSNTVPDLRFDPAHEQFAKYCTGGTNNGPVGDFGRPTVTYSRVFSNAGAYIGDSRWPGSFVNDSNYYDTAWQDITVVTGTNDKIDFEEGAGELTAAIAAGTYTNSGDYATAINAALTAAAAATIAVTISATERLTLSSDGTQFDLLWATGTNTAISAGSDMGFDISTDDTGQSLYGGDSPLVVGGTAGRTSALVASDTIKIDLGFEPAATSARAVSPVIDLLTPQKLLRLYLTLDVDGLGEVDDDAAAPRTLQVRAQNTPFDAQDAAATTTLDWTSIQRDGLETVAHTYRYWQIGVTLRIDALV